MGNVRKHAQLMIIEDLFIERKLRRIGHDMRMPEKRLRLRASFEQTEGHDPQRQRTSASESNERREVVENHNRSSPEGIWRIKRERERKKEQVTKATRGCKRANTIESNMQQEAVENHNRSCTGGT